MVDALTPIADFNERFGADFDDDEYDTIGGLVTAAIGHLPEAGEELDAGPLRASASPRADARRVHALPRQRACVTLARSPARTLLLRAAAARCCAAVRGAGASRTPALAADARASAC